MPVFKINITKEYINKYNNFFRDGTDLEYRFNSKLITVAVLPLNQAIDAKMEINLKIRHLQNHSRSWNISCGVAGMAGSWDLDSCITKLFPEDGTTQCTCTRPGTFAVFLTARAVRVRIVH